MDFKDNGSFEIERDWYDDGVPLFGKDFVTVFVGVTSLVGCNGAGKTTLMSQMRRQVEERGDDSIIIAFDAKEEPRKRLGEFGYLSGDTELVSDVAGILSSSEGEGMSFGVNKLMRRLGAIVGDEQGTSDIWLFADAVDSGMDAPMLRQLMDVLKLVSKDMTERGHRFYALVASNSFECARYDRCLCVPSLEYEDFDAYDEWYGFIERTAKEKDDRYKRINAKKRKEGGRHGARR